MGDFKILVCGGRDFYRYYLLKENLDRVLSDIWEEDDETKITIIAGGAIGADFLAKVYALDEWDLNYLEFPANWKLHGKKAGPIRNQQMLDEGRPNLVVAFPGGVGTADMVARAKKSGVEVIEVDG